ncbi:Ail/Lom family outer membrane beta-barrel protein [Pseudomonas fluorescens]|uniref:Ail/Lom family outer membrane beta-barrel protein n=1 Tax=Pseudomonas fluorescens TaxID=294 RepID=UPI002738C363|nr:Ail/Lom family outer membrane beta-barrel protein [Pseudomonas fluorescens]WLH76515.1 Ail/Lom family outer membrane beta-barrel protein [Pseudomonas fluorescens]
MSGQQAANTRNTFNPKKPYPQHGKSKALNKRLVHVDKRRKALQVLILNLYSRGIKMKLTILACAPLIFFGIYSEAARAEPSSTLTIGYAQSHVTGSAADRYASTPLSSSLNPGAIFADAIFGDSRRKSGFNLKYRYELDSNLGFIVSYTDTGGIRSSGNNKKTLQYRALTAGPSYRFNDYFSVYGGLGVSHGEYGIDVTHANGRLKESDAKYGLASIVGAQVNVFKNVTLDTSYEYSKLDVKNSKTGKFGTWAVGLGYKF